MTRVLFVHSSAGRYGADRQLLALATGVEGAVCVLPFEGELAGDLRAAGVETVVRPVAVLRRALLTPGGLPRVAAAAVADGLALARLARERRADLVHSNTSVTLAGAVAARRAGLPHVWHVREIYAGFARAWPAYRRVLLSADALPCVSEATRAPFGAAGAARVVYDGLPTAPVARDRADARAALGLPPDGFVVAVLGRVSAWKGQDVAIRALAAPPLSDRHDATLLLAGAPWPGQEGLERALRDLAAGLGVAERVRFGGFVEDVAAVYGAADVVAVPSTLPDPFPNAALEAAAAGCCVVASAHGGLPELLDDGRTGVLVAPGDPAALAAAIASLAADDARRARLGAAARQDVAARFSLDAMRASIAAVHREVLAGR